MSSRKVAVVLVLLAYSNAHAECKFSNHNGKTIYSTVDTLPKYVGGELAFLEFISKNYIYPAQEIFQASFNLEFIIDSNGSLIAPKILSESSVMTPAEKELIRVVCKMPKWKAGKCNGNKVSVQMYIPLKF